MKIDEILLIEKISVERAFKKVGNKIRKQFRCIGGPKDGRVVAKSVTCIEPIDKEISVKSRHSAKASAAERIAKTSATKRKGVGKSLRHVNNKLRKTKKIQHRKKKRTVKK